MFERFVRRLSLVAILAVSPMAVAQSASELLEKGIYTEETAGDLDCGSRKLIHLCYRAKFVRGSEAPRAVEAHRGIFEFNLPYGTCSI